MPTKTVNGITVTFRGELRMPQSTIEMEFKNAQGQLVDVGKVKLTLDMNMPGMVMHDVANVSGSAGNYSAKIKPKMVGDWNAKLTFNSPQGPAETQFRVAIR